MRAFFIITLLCTSVTLAQAPAPSAAPARPATAATAAPPATRPADVAEGDLNVTTFAYTGPSGQFHAMVVVPSDYHRPMPAGTPERRYPVVYLLHGHGVDHTRYYNKLREAGRPLTWFADRYGVIIVTPEGGRASWYLDAPAGTTDPASWQIETMITRHLIPEVDRRFRTWAEPAGRGVSGISMGGHGALYLAARHPDLFGVCTGLSGVMDLTATLNKANLAARLGPLEEFPDRWREHSVITQAEKFAGRSTGILIDCGWTDPFFESHRALHAKLMELKVAHDYIERPGAHTWDYWINALPYHFQFLSDRLRPAGQPVRPPEPVSFRPVIVARNLPADPYCVDIADMNHDGRPDIVLTLFDRVIWYENPGWQPHLISAEGTRQNVAGVVHDIDADGLPDIAIGADWMFHDTRRKGTVWWARHTPEQSPWPLFHVDGEPSIHRLRWIDVEGDGVRELLVAPLKGIETTPPHFSERGVRLFLLRIPPRPATDHWLRENIADDLRVCHGAIAVQFEPDPAEEILTASFEGVHLFKRLADGSWTRRHLGAGEQRTSPSRGSSEVALGRLADGRRIIATIEPWHGHEVVVYLESPDPEALWPRFILDETFSEGHAIACTDFDGNGHDEIVAGYRGRGRDGNRPTSLKIYYAIDPDRGRWQSEWIDEGDMATEDLKIADMNDDGRPDVIACGRSTRNLKVYFNNAR